MQQNVMPSSINDVETTYRRATTMINSLMTKHRLIKRIKLIDGDLHIFYQLAQGNRKIINLINQGADVHLIIQEMKPSFEVALESQVTTIDLPKLKEDLLRTQLSQLNGQQMQFPQKICREHNFNNDFYNTQQGEEYIKDECPVLLKEKFETFKIQDQDQMLEILKRYLKKSQIDSYNKELIDLRFYINYDFEIVVEYKINDNSLSLHQKVKRRKWSEILNSVRHNYAAQQIEEITQCLLEQLFYVDEIQLNQQRRLLYNIIENFPQHYQGLKGEKLYTHKQRIWNIVGFMSKTFNIHKRFSKYKIIIVQNQQQLFFLNHSELIKLEDLSLSQPYIQLIEQSQKRLEQLKQSLQAQHYTVDQMLLKEITKTTQLINEQQTLAGIESKLVDLYQQQQTVMQELEQLEDPELLFSEARLQLLDQNDQLFSQISTYESINKEYQRVYGSAIESLKKFQGANSQQNNKIKLKAIYNRVLLEKFRVEQHLPIYSKKQELISAIKKQKVTLLIGETGSGKSTQLVQYISEENLTFGKVICVEPRMLAARQLARRVAEEMNTKIGEGVGYLTEFGEVAEKTKIVFTQDRIILNLLLKDSLLSEYEIVIIDEAHERTMNTDILLGLMKQLLQKRNNIKLVIMSATMDEELFSNYFQCQIYKVVGKLYPIKIKYQDGFRDDYLEQIQLLLCRKVLEKINKNIYNQRHVLVFLAGVDEINRLLQIFQNNFRNRNVEYLGLHGSMATDEQFEVFRETNKVKIIFATRVAETALTINDVSVVVDIGVDRFIQFDQMRSMQITTVGMISQAQANQRAGRAGRTTPGVCYRLYSEFEFEKMQKHKVPEIQRCNLDSIVLKLKCFQVDALNFDFIQRPVDQAIINSLEYLKDIQALDEQKRITPLGELMAQIQTEPRMSRILIEAFYRDVFQEVLSIISVMLNNSTLFLRNFNVDTRIELLDESGDFMTFYKIFWQFKALAYSNPVSYLKQYCLKNGYHFKTLRVCENTFDEIYKTFSCFSEQLYANEKVKKQILWSSDQTKEDSVMRCFLVAFHPDICVYNGNPFIGYTFIKNQKSVRIYGSCALSLLNHYPKYIICTDLYSSRFDFCKVAQEVTIEQLKQVLDEKQLENLSNYIPNSYHYQELSNIPLSLMNHLMHKFSSIYEGNQFIQYCNLDRDKCCFQIWSKEMIDLEKEKKDYYEIVKNYHFCKFYGQKMLVYFKHGCEVHSTQMCSITELTIIQFIDCPYSIDVLRSILDYHKLNYTNIFEINANQFGYCGQIFTNEYNTAKEICDTLNYECQRYFQEYQINFERKMLFFIQPRSIKNRIVKPVAEVRFYGCKNKGFGFLTFNNQKDADLFLVETAGIVKFQDKLQDLKQAGDKENKNKNKNKIRISNVPDNADEKQFETYLRGLAIQKEVPTPLNVNLIPQESEAKDWGPQITKLFEQHLHEKPYVEVKQDKNNYRNLARVSLITSPLKLEEMRKKINLEYNILGCSTVSMKTEYKIIRFIHSSVLEKNSALIQKIKDELLQKFSEELLNIFIRVNNLIILGKSPNLVRLASNRLHGVTTGFLIQIQLTKKIFRDLLEENQFIEELMNLESVLGFRYHQDLLFRGKILIYTENDKLGEITEAINKLVSDQVQKNVCVDVRNYTFKPLLNINDNILEELSRTHKVSIDFSITQKKVFIYGNHANTIKCKETLLKNLQQVNTSIQDPCLICFGDIVERFILGLCGHYFCKGCLLISIQSQVKLFPKCCPQCKETISLQDLQQLLCETDFDKLLGQSFTDYKGQNAQLYVQCKTADCEEFFLKAEEGQDPFYYCESCLCSFCTACTRIAHPKLTCEQAKEQFLGEKPLTDEEMKNLNIKKCPKCQTMVEKDKGCNHMMCKTCKNHFCWICLHQANNDKDIYDHIGEMHPGQLHAQVY